MQANQFLDHLRVLDLSQYIPGPYATRQLADLGADVIKIEPPGGDPMRRFMLQEVEYSPIYQHLNRGKRISQLDLKTDEGKEILLNLIASADVLLESYRPGTLERLGFARQLISETNPGLIHCALSGYGQTGPYRLRAGHDINYCALSGLLINNGNPTPPRPAFPPLADHASSLQACITILAALIARARSGAGCYIDLSLYETALTWSYLPILQESSSAAAQLLSGGTACYNVYQCSDGVFISLGAIEQHFWKSFCQCVDRDNWATRQFETMPQTELIAELKALFSQHPRAYWDELFKPVDCCYEPLLAPDELADFPQAAFLGSVTQAGPEYPGRVDSKRVVIADHFTEIEPGSPTAWLNS